VYTLPLEQSTLSPTNTSFFHARHSQAETNNGCRDHKRRPRPNYKPQIIYNVKDDRQLQNVSCAPRRSKNQRTTYSLPAQRQKVSRMKSWAEPHRLATTRHGASGAWWLKSLEQGTWAVLGMDTMERTQQTNLPKQAEERAMVIEEATSYIR
jgi:hypothetical protein